MALTFNHQTNDISNATGTVTFNGVAVGGDNTPPVWFGGRGLFGGGTYPATNAIQYITIANTGNVTDFGDLTVTRHPTGACSNGERGVWAGGNAYQDVIDYVTISTTGNATDFGDLNQAGFPATCSDGIKGLFAGAPAASGKSNIIDYITISTTGNAADFGDLVAANSYKYACASNTRGLFAGGYDPLTAAIDYVTTATTGNASDFGDMTVSKMQGAGLSNATYGVFCGGATSSTQTTNTMDYVTMATTGNATDFGDLTQARRSLAACSSGTRGVIGGGGGTAFPPVRYDVIDYITIASAGNATDFGDLAAALEELSACAGD
jgi:hypothetical protein